MKVTDKRLDYRIRQKWDTFLEYNIKVPAVLKEKFPEMTPIFKNIEISWNDIGGFMQAHTEKQNLERAAAKYDQQLHE